MNKTLFFLDTLHSLPYAGFTQFKFNGLSFTLSQPLSRLTSAPREMKFKLYIRKNNSWLNAIGFY